MASEIIQVEYDTLEVISQRFMAQSEDMVELERLLYRAMDRLEGGGWQGRGSAAFYAEMGDEVLPAIKRLVEALLAGAQTVADIEALFQQAEEEAAALFSEYSVGGTGPNMPGLPIILGIGALIIGGTGAFIWWGSQDLEGKSSDEAYKKIADVLDNHESGRAALQRAKDLDVGFELSAAGSGTYYDPETNTMYIDPTSHPELAASSFIHEVTHAQQQADGQMPDVTQVTREEYVQRLLEMEAEAVIAELQYEKETFVLDRLSNPEHEKAYWDTYDDTLRDLKKSDPDMPADERERLAYEAGKAKLIEYYENGHFKTSTTGQSYVDYYGDYWDGENTTVL